jgi:sec-independent protein translocase protein TatB
MFEIGFSEILLIFVIALVVLGPEKLPKLAAQVGRWAGRAKSMARQFREQLESEVDLEQALTPRGARAPDPAPAASEAPATEPASEAPPPPTPDDYSAAHDPMSQAYASPPDVPMSAPAPEEPAPPVQVDAFEPEARDGTR